MSNKNHSIEFEKVCLVSVDILNVISLVANLVIMVIAPFNFVVILKTSVCAILLICIIL